jgi:hypothetical protein
LISALANIYFRRLNFILTMIWSFLKKGTGRRAVAILKRGKCPRAKRSAQAYKKKDCTTTQ